MEANSEKNSLPKRSQREATVSVFLLSGSKEETYYHCSGMKALKLLQKREKNNLCQDTRGAVRTRALQCVIDWPFLTG